MRLRRLLAMGLGLLLVLSMAPPAAGASTSVRHVIRTSAWSVPSPDPTGIDLYNGQLLVTDSEVDETGLNRHRNIWRTTLTGAVRKTMSTLRFSHEPTDVAADPARNVWYFADDTSFGGVRGRIFVKDLGPDRIYGTRDDRRRSFATSPFGSTDPEGLAFGGGHLWISDGSNGSLYRIRPGPNGKIEGAGTDDIITVLDIKGLGANDLEGVEFANGRLFVLPNQKNADILELNPLDGSLLRVFDLSTAGLVNPSGLAFGPSSTNPSRNAFYVADRGRDNNTHPNENDGRIVELVVVASPPNLIRNGSFEADRNHNGRPDLWSDNLHFTRTSLARHIGNFSGRHRATDDSSYSVRQDLNDVVAGETYHFDGWTKIPATSDSFTYRVRIVWFGSSGNRIGNTIMATFTTPRIHWARTTADVLAPSGTVRAKMVMSVINLNATIYVDGFSLTVVS